MQVKESQGLQASQVNLKNVLTRNSVMNHYQYVATVSETVTHAPTDYRFMAVKSRKVLNLLFVGANTFLYQYLTALPFFRLNSSLRRAVHPATIL